MVVALGEEQKLPVHDKPFGTMISEHAFVIDEQYEMFNKGRHYRRITDLLVKGQFCQAIAVIEGARQILPLPVYLECQGNIHFYQRDFQQAITKYEEAMQVDAEHDVARYHYLIGIRKERNGKFAEAFDRYEAAIAIEPTFVDTYVELGGLLAKVNDLEGALKCYTDALELDSGDLRIFSNRADVLKCLCGFDSMRYAEEYRDALIAFETAKRVLPPIDEGSVW